MFKAGNIVEYMSQPSERCILLVSDCKSFLLSASPSSTLAGIKLFNLIAVEINPSITGERVTKLVYLDN